MLGCSHDNGYARFLEDESNPSNLSRITLLEGVPFERELHKLKSRYRTTKFDDLFRNTKIGGHQYNPLKKTRSTSPIFHAADLARPEGKEHVNGATKPATPWTNVVTSAPPASPSGQAEPSKEPSPGPGNQDRIPVNRYGQRVDWPLKVSYDKHEVARVKSLNLCQKYYLLGNCYDNNCNLEHDLEIDLRTLEYLKLFGRAIPCKQGLNCKSKHCTYGHGKHQDFPRWRGFYLFCRIVPLMLIIILYAQHVNRMSPELKIAIGRGITRSAGSHHTCTALTSKWSRPSSLVLFRTLRCRCRYGQCKPRLLRFVHSHHLEG